MNDEPNMPAPVPESKPTLEAELTALLNKHSQENASDTPDYILSQFLLSSLAAFNQAVSLRDRYYGRGKYAAVTPL